MVTLHIPKIVIKTFFFFLPNIRISGKNVSFEDKKKFKK